MTSDFAPEMQRVIALALAEAHHRCSPILRQTQDKPWAHHTCSSRWLDRILHLGYNQVCLTTTKHGRQLKACAAPSC